MNGTSIRRGALTLAVAIALGSFAGRAEAQAAPTRMVDESELFVRLWTEDPERGYVLRVDTVVYGVGSRQDAIRIDVAQRGRALTSVRCPFQNTDGDAGELQCETDSSRPLTATGEISVDLVYLDDQTETAEVIRSMTLRVNAYPYWVRDDGRRSIMGAKYQIDGSDQLGTAFAYMERPSLQQTSTQERQGVFFFTTFAGSPEGRAAAMRCTANGQRLDDREVHVSAHGEYGVEERLSSTSDIRRLNWYRARIEVDNLWWGTRLPMEDGVGYDPSTLIFLGDHPGAWSCDLRQDGRVLRQFRFTVDAQGRIVRHAEHDGPSGMRVIPGLTMVDVRFPSASTSDTAFDPAAIRRASQFGRPWSAPDAVREMLAALPAASGSSAPSSGGGGRRRGR